MHPALARYLDAVTEAYEYKNTVLTPAMATYDRTHSETAWRRYCKAGERFSALLSRAMAIWPEIPEEERK